MFSFQIGAYDILSDYYYDYYYFNSSSYCYYNSIFYSFLTAGKREKRNKIWILSVDANILGSLSDHSSGGEWEAYNS